MVDTITTVESITCDEEPDPITQDTASDSGVLTHHQSDSSRVRLHSGPPDNEVCLPVPIEPPDMQVLPNTNTKCGRGYSGQGVIRP